VMVAKVVTISLHLKEPQSWMISTKACRSLGYSSPTHSLTRTHL